MGSLISTLYKEERAVYSSPPGSIPSKLWFRSVNILCPLHHAKGGFTIRPLLVVWKKISNIYYLQWSYTGLAGTPSHKSFTWYLQHGAPVTYIYYEGYKSLWDTVHMTVSISYVKRTVITDLPDPMTRQDTNSIHRHLQNFVTFPLWITGTNYNNFIILTVS